MSNELINPRVYVPGHIKELDPRFAGGKNYYAKLGGAQPVLVGTQPFKRASEADSAAQAWKERLVAEYDAHLAALVNGDARDEANVEVPATAEGLPQTAGEL